MEPTIDALFPLLAERWGVPVGLLEGYYADLQGSAALLSGLNAAIRDEPRFAGVRFTHVRALRIYRSLLYLITRVVRPGVFVETGVLNGFSSAFILLAMHHNGQGTLCSVDLPPDDPRIVAQGTAPLPEGKGPGWAIPGFLRGRHVLALGEAQVLLPRIFAEHRPLDIFLHDSDHCYSHMMFEMALAWLYLRPGGWLLSDNIEQNLAFDDLTRGVGCPGFVVSSFDTADRVWRHGLVQKPTEGIHLG